MTRSCRLGNDGIAIFFKFTAAAYPNAKAISLEIMPQCGSFCVGIAVAAFAFVQGIARLGTGLGDDRVGIGVVGGHFVDRFGDALFNAQAVGVVGEFHGNVPFRRAAFGRFQAAPLCPREVPRRAVVVPDGVSAHRRARDVAVLVHRLTLVDDLLAVKGGQEVLPRGAAVGVGAARRSGQHPLHAIVHLACICTLWFRAF